MPTMGEGDGGATTSLWRPIARPEPEDDAAATPTGEPEAPAPERPRRAKVPRAGRSPRATRIRRALIALAVLAGLGLVGEGLWINVLRHDLGESRASDASARTQLLATRTRMLRDVEVLLRKLDAMTLAYRNQTKAKNNLQGQLTATIDKLKRATDDLAATQSKLGTTKQDLDNQVVRLAVTRQCLTGVQQALERASVDDFAGAVKAVQAVDSACTSALDKSKAAVGHAVYDGSAADPFVLKAGGKYYGYTTNSIGGSVQLLEGDTVGDLRLKGPALANLASWATPGGTWGPTVLQRGDRWVLYYTARIKGMTQSCISRAVSNSPAGPFLDDSVLPIVCQLDRNGSIDPSPTVSIDGTPWLVWKSEGVGFEPSRIWSQRLTPDGLAVTGDAVGLITANEPWEHGVVEGPALIQHRDRWLLFYSADDWNSSAYAIGFAVCDGPQGPCRKPQHAPIFQPPAPLVGAGGQELFTGPDGTAWMAFHAWVEGQVGYPNLRRLYVARVDLDAAIPRITQVTDQ